MSNHRGQNGRTLGGVARAVGLGSLPPLLLLAWWHFSSDSVSVPTVGEVIDVLVHPFREPALDSLSLGYSALISFLRVLLGFTLAAATAIKELIAAGDLSARVPEASGDELGELAQGLRVVDLSADFRLPDPQVYEQWYATPHTQTALLQTAVYGLCEININRPIHMTAKTHFGLYFAKTNTGTAILQ